MSAGRRARALAGRLLGLSRSPSALTPGIAPLIAGRDGSLRELAGRAIPHLGADPIVIGYLPLVRNNPFQQMLYARGWGSGIGAIPLADLAAAEELADAGARAWLHIHWTAWVLAGARDRAAAERKLQGFERTLDLLIARGARIAWTVHNVLPHEHRFADLEAAAGGALASRAHLIHTLTPDTATLTTPHFTLPADRVVLIEHSSYEGIYTNIVDRAEARARLGIGPDALVLSAIGAIRRYKGLDGLLDAFAEVGDPDMRLVIAGPPVSFPEARALLRRCEAQRGVIARFERIPETDLQLYMNASDAVVLPYSDVLNSGALMLAFTFGRPVIAARAGAMATLVGSDAGLLFTPGDQASLASALKEAGRLRDPSYREAAIGVARARPPAAMSEAFARAIRDFS